MSHHGSMCYSSTPLEIVWHWLESRLFSVRPFLSHIDSLNFASIYSQTHAVYRDCLVHFFHFGHRARSLQDGWAKGLMVEASILPFYHSSGVWPLAYMVGAASLADALGFMDRAARLLQQEEEAHAANDLERFLPLLSSRSDLAQKAVGRVRQHVATVLKDVPGCIDAFDRAVRQRGVGLDAATRDLVRRAIHGRLVCLSGFGPRPYTVEDAERLVASCRSEGLAVEIAGLNGENTIIIGGPSHDVGVAEVLAREGKVGRPPFLVSKVLVDGAPHTSRYRQAAEKCRGFLDEAIGSGSLTDPAIPFVNCQGSLVQKAIDVREALVATLDRTFRFDLSCAAFLASQPRALLAGLGKESTPGHNVVEAAILDQARRSNCLVPPIVRTIDLFSNGLRRGVAREAVARRQPVEVPWSMPTFDELDDVRAAWEKLVYRRRSARGNQSSSADTEFLDQTVSV